MQYNHLYIYTPEGKEPNNKNDSYKIPIVSDKKKPTNSEHSQSIRMLSNLIDPYSARNYWEKNKIIVSPINPPWSSSILLMNRLDNLSFVDTLTHTSSNEECMFNIETDIKKTVLERFLNRLYDTKDTSMRIEKTKNGYNLFTRWYF